MYPFSDQDHAKTLPDGATHTYSLYKGVPPPPGIMAFFMFFGFRNKIKLNEKVSQVYNITSKTQSKFLEDVLTNCLISVWRQNIYFFNYKRRNGMYHNCHLKDGSSMSRCVKNISYYIYFLLEKDKHMFSSKLLFIGSDMLSRKIFRNQAWLNSSFFSNGNSVTKTHPSICILNLN